MTRVLTPTPRDVESFGAPDPKAPPVERLDTYTLLATQLFPAPIPMGAVLNSVYVAPGFSLNPLQGSMVSAQLTLAQLTAMLAAFKAGLAQAQVALFTNNLTPSPSLTFANLVEPTGSWYAHVNTTLGAVQQFPDGSVGFKGSSAEFDYTGSSSAQNIVGWALLNLVVT